MFSAVVHSCTVCTKYEEHHNNGTVRFTQKIRVIVNRRVASVFAWQLPALGESIDVREKTSKHTDF